MHTKGVVADAMGERASGRIPPTPRAVMNGIVILPQVDENFVPIQDMWVLPGCAVLSTDELRTRARANGVALDFILN